MCAVSYAYVRPYEWPRVCSSLDNGRVTTAEVGTESFYNWTSDDRRWHQNSTHRYWQVCLFLTVCHIAAFNTLNISFGFSPNLPLVQLGTKLNWLGSCPSQRQRKCRRSDCVLVYLVGLYLFLGNGLRNLRLMRICFTDVFFCFFFPSATTMRQPFSGTPERIFMKLLPNDSGENGVFNVVPKWGLGPK